MLQGEKYFERILKRLKFQALQADKSIQNKGLEEMISKHINPMLLHSLLALSEKITFVFFES